MTSRNALVVDNDHVMVKTLAGILTEQGYAVTCAYGGLDALQHLSRSVFDVALLDLIMPRIGGDRICRYIQQATRHAHTKVMFVSAAALEAQQKIKELKPFACIAKAPFPVLRANIIKALNELNRADRHDATLVFSEGVQPRRVVEELLFAQRHFEAVLSSMTDAVFELDTHGIITYVNRSARTLLNRDEWELVGRPFRAEFSEHNPTVLDEALARIIQTDEFRTEHISLQHRQRECELLLQPVVRDEICIGVSVVLRDITEKKQLDQERCLRERLAGVIEMAGTAAHELNQPLTVISGHAQLLVLECAENPDLSSRAHIIQEQIARLGRLSQQFSTIVTYKTKSCCETGTIIDIEKASKNTNDTRRT